MANPALAGSLFDSGGVAVSGATVNVYAAGDTVTVIATTTTGAGGSWSIADSSVQNPDIEIVNGTEITRYKYSDKVAFTTVDVINQVLRNSSGVSSFSHTVLADNLSTNFVTYAPVTYMKSSDQSVTDSTLVNDVHMQHAAASGAFYTVEAGVSFHQQGSSGDPVAKWNVPTGANFQGYWNSGPAGSAVSNPVTDASSAILHSGSSAAQIGAIFHGYLETSAAAGTVTPQWRQADADASATLIEEGSWMRITRQS